MYFFIYQSLIGPLRIVATADSITGISFTGEKSGNAIEKKTELIKEAIRQLDEYFAGKRTEFDLPLALSGTSFQKKVWTTLRSIPYGETRSYREIAVLAGNEKACRAVGMANNRNPLPVIIPCHRVVGTNGSLVGYAGGLEVKTQLLQLESSGRLL
jgi:methylated-DNA-[protein]-cysteine S-methyltransferase